MEEGQGMEVREVEMVVGGRRRVRRAKRIVGKVGKIDIVDCWVGKMEKLKKAK